MKTYKDLLIKLASTGFKDISGNYSGGGATLLHVGYGHNENPWPRHQLRVFRTQERNAERVYFQDWMEVCGSAPLPIRLLEDIWVAGMALATEAMTPQEVV